MNIKLKKAVFFLILATTFLVVLLFYVNRSWSNDDWTIDPTYYNNIYEYKNTTLIEKWTKVPDDDWKIDPANESKPHDHVILYFLITKVDDDLWGAYSMRCAVEAACRTHPQNPIKILHVPELDVLPTETRRCKLICPQLEFEHYVPYNDIVQFPVLNKWWTSQYSLQYNGVSDVLRYLLLYTRGGIYLDTDFVPFKTLSDLPNVIGEQGPTVSYYDLPSAINGAVMKFDRGNEFILECLKEVTRVIIDPAKVAWASLGPDLLTKIYFNNFTNSTDVVKKMPKEAFYAIFWRDYPIISLSSQHSHVKIVKDLLDKGGYGLHLWYSNTKYYKPAAGTFYREIITEYCPMTLNK